VNAARGQDGIAKGPAGSLAGIRPPHRVLRVLPPAVGPLAQLSVHEPVRRAS
jgi:hypothetical protein